MTEESPKLDTQDEQEARLVRPAEGRWLSGVCAALGEQLGMPVWLLRLAFGVSFLGLPLAPLVYILSGSVPGSLILGILGAASWLGYLLTCFLIPDGRRGKHFRWEFVTSSSIIVFASLTGHAVLKLAAPFWDWGAALYEEGGLGDLLWLPVAYAKSPGYGVREILFLGFCVSSLVYLFLQRQAVRRFFRSMFTGVSVVTLSLLAVTAGVLVPQIDGFEDKTQRVDLGAEKEKYELFKQYGGVPRTRVTHDNNQYQAFRWAEGYFLYHLVHLYGIGMPEAPLPPRAVEGLERYGRVYGFEESENRRKQMSASFSGEAKKKEISELIRDNEDRFWRFFEVSTWLELNRAYKADWFTSLMTLLFIAVAFNTFKGGWSRVFSIKKVGFFVVHCGILILLIGGGCSKITTKRGILELRLDQPPKDQYYLNYDPTQKDHLPFKLALEHFARQDWKSLQVELAEERFVSRPPSYTLWKGREIDLDYYEDDAGEWKPRLRLVVKDLHERTAVDLPFVSETPPGNADGWGPMVELEYALPPGQDPHDHGPGDDAFHRTLLAPGPEAQGIVSDGARLMPAYGALGDPEDLDELEALFPPAGTDYGNLWVQVAGMGDGMAQRFPLRIGERIRVQGGYEVEVVEASTNAQGVRSGGNTYWKADERPLSEQPVKIVALWVNVYPPEGQGPPEERRELLELIDPLAYGHQSRYLYIQVYVHFDWDRWKSPGLPRYVVHWGPDQEPLLIGQDGSIAELALGEDLDLPGESRFRVKQLLHDAGIQKNLTFMERRIREDGWDEDFYSREPKGLELEVIHYPEDPERRVVEEALFASTQDAASDIWEPGDGRFRIRFFENREMLPFEWRSVLSVYEKDAKGNDYEVDLGSEEDREIRVNDYFTYGNYHFFQTNAIPEDPTYSGIGVVYDRGIPWVLTGMYTIIAGAVIAFLVRPAVLAFRSRKESAA